MSKLDPEFKAKWCAALRSGKYKQSHYALHSRMCDTYCVLGVALAVAEKPMIYVYLDDLIPDGQLELMVMNDDERKSFPEIADYIEANL